MTHLSIFGSVRPKRSLLRKRFFDPALFFVSLIICATTSLAIDAEKPPPCSAVHFDGEQLMCIGARLGSIEPAERATLIENRLTHLADDFKFDVDSITVLPGEDNAQINAGDLIIASLRPVDLNLADGHLLVKSVNEIADHMKTAIRSHRENLAPKALMTRGLKALCATLGLILALWFLSRVFSMIQTKIGSSKEHWIRSLTIKNFEILNAARISSALSAVTSLARLLLTLLAIYIYLPLVFSFFPWTADWTPKLYGYISHPLFKIGRTLVDFIPNFFFIVIIFFITRYILRLVQFFFAEVERGHVQLDGFYAEWSGPTYKLVRVIVVAFAFVMAFPYIPGSSSPAFQGVSVFLGLLLSLGSSSAIGNVVAGIVITYMRPFKIGDRVQISDTVGDVTEKNLLVTRIRTIKNVDVTIPNAIVLANHIVNYSAHANEEGLIIHTSVTIGYDVPWTQVHQLLQTAATQTEGIDLNKKPFVLQTALSDFYVEYQINAYTREASRMAVIGSWLHQKIQDEFNKANVEIMSPHYASLRDGNHLTIPTANKKAELT